MRILDPKNPVLSTPVSAADLRGRPRFVVVEIAHVENPKMMPLNFTVGFRPASGADVTLGTFSLYPANNPGRFIVATQGKVYAGGQIFLTFFDRNGDLSGVRVGVASLTLGSR